MKTHTKTKPETPKTVDLRERLKALLERELERLPETLDALEAKDRLAIVAKLMPLVLPKAKPVNFDLGEPNDWFSIG